MTDSVIWYVNRATGIVSLLLLTVVAVLGIAVAGRMAGTPVNRALAAGLHRISALLGVAFVTVHVLSAVLDSYVSIGWVSVLLPFTSGYQPLWVGLGTVALDLLIALVVTSLLRGRLPRRAWRAVHWSAYGLWPIALAHGLGAGTDLGGGAFLVLALACVAVVLGAAGWRWSRLRSAPARPDLLHAGFVAGRQAAVRRGSSW